ncbi:nicotinamidase-related amidase [Salirhabdus euzebyi]|uniref:Nicotinamidase-related amidase n=1 Tax=Salirhabdus euzebyi TaxID=394506 RepID=A0A841PUL9_9BACI|nr:cysteine hydrolase family protein [Salirhabdus euzebyi]MBB6452559.1 nicotinamidase-related amidase [Salirhabdus euzebyi]
MKALVIIDVQNGMFQESNVVFKGLELLQHLNVFIKKARTSNTSIFYVQHNGPSGKPLEFGTEGWEIHSKVMPKKEDTIIQKTTPDSFLHTTLNEELKKQGIDHLILTGIQTEACVDTTCRRAFSLGYEVTLVSDLHSTWSSEDITAQQIINHHNRVLRWFANVQGSDEIRF